MKLFGWLRRKPKLPDIPPSPYRVPVIDLKPLQPKDPDMIVEESELTSTGLWRLFPHKKPLEK